MNSWRRPRGPDRPRSRVPGVDPNAPSLAQKPHHPAGPGGKLIPSPPVMRTEILAPVLIVLLAAALRIYALGSLPPGLYYDESANGVDALRVLAGAHPVFFTGDQGREPLHIYLEAVAIALIGPSPLALRLPSVALGILSVAATYTTFRAFAGRTVGLIGAFLLAVSFWHLSLSRLAFRAIDLPLFSTLAAYWLWKGLGRGKLIHFALAGVFLGLDLYTYIPARLAPPLIVFWVLAAGLVPAWRGTSSRRVLLGGGIVLVAGSIVAFPLGYHFLRHPYDFYERAQNASGTALTVNHLVSGFDRALRGLLWTGDSNPRHNLPGRPLIDPPIALIGVLGLIFGLTARDPATVFSLIWCVAMVAPAAFSDEPAHALRLTGLIPFALYFPARGVAGLGQVRRPTLRRIAEIAALAMLASSVVFTARDYFITWATRPDVAQAFDADLVQPLRLLNQVPPRRMILATSEVYAGQAIPLPFISNLSNDTRGFAGSSVFVIPSGTNEPAYYLYGSTFKPPSGVPFADHLVLLAASRDRYGRISGELFRMDPPFPELRPSRPVAARIGSAVEVNGSDIVPLVHPGETVRVALYWTAREIPPSSPGQFFAHLVDRSPHRLLAQDYNEGFPPNEWREGDRVISWFDLRVPDDAPAAVADIDFGLFDPSTGERVNVKMPDGRSAGNTVIVGPVRVDRPVPVPAPRGPAYARFGAAMVLTGYDLDHPQAGQEVVRLHWLSNGPIAQDYTIFVHALDVSGKVIAGDDSQPARGRFPTSTWAKGETYLDPHLLRLPPGVKADKIEIGVYLLSTGQRLPRFDASGEPLGDALTITNR